MKKKHTLIANSVAPSLVAKPNVTSVSGSPAFPADH